ncbi:tRNA pseudouridine synthase A [Arthrobacter sp. EH-1B-1]|uniref:tRNA pseudouridine synthase A n=1 Tax=Arthrobacter vasquezii TaxID=2977629 RepID=A0ABT6CZ84_9MICC|nr:tRNA pseudouridine synthase A [Arthrobacter vasquezii]MDF9279309.1 tRNA pseudouridine synthase A [Arthrobacter vasquezii]
MNEQMPVIPSVDGGHLRVRIDLAYDGGPFSGWAVQPGLPTVQGTVESGLELLFRRRVRLTVAGRTDAGVHARGQVTHIDLEPGEWLALSRGRDIDPALALKRRLQATVNRYLPPGVAARTAYASNPASPVVVRAVRLAPAGFDARFSALWRRYSYRIADRLDDQDPLHRSTVLWHSEELDEGLLNEGARPLLGLQDFRAFCKPRVGATTVRELQRFEFEREPDGVLRATIQADAFCHNMVRALIGGALRVGSGEEPPEWMGERLRSRQKDSRSVLAPAHPLVLEEVRYPDDAAELALRAELTRAKRDHVRDDA